MNVIADRNVPLAFTEAFWKMRVWAEEAESRNGTVMRCPDVFLEIRRPMERVLFDRVRLANPFFHLMESIWMLAGEDDVTWLKQFNKRIETYAETNGRIHGAYGRRWRSHFGIDQVVEVRDLLYRDPGTRRAVIGMWDPDSDCNVEKNDLPCNTHIYLTVNKYGLEMTVCNRSNDLVWGMLGANCVHMTILQQVLAESLGLDVASYKVFTKDLHVYKSLPNFRQLWDNTYVIDPYSNGRVSPVPILEEQRLQDFLDDCRAFIRGHKVRNMWLQKTAAPMREAYLERLLGADGLDDIEWVEASDWRMAAQLYVEQKELAAQKAEEV